MTLVGVAPQHCCSSCYFCWPLLIAVALYSLIICMIRMDVQKGLRESDLLLYCVFVKGRDALHIATSRQVRDLLVNSSSSLLPTGEERGERNSFQVDLGSGLHTLSR